MIRVLHHAIFGGICSQVVCAHLDFWLLGNFSIDIVKPYLILFWLLHIRRLRPDLSRFVYMAGLSLYLSKSARLVVILVFIDCLQFVLGNGFISRQVQVGFLDVLDVDDVVAQQLRRHLFISADFVHHSWVFSAPWPSSFAFYLSTRRKFWLVVVDL